MDTLTRTRSMAASVMQDANAEMAALRQERDRLAAANAFMRVTLAAENDRLERANRAELQVARLRTALKAAKDWGKQATAAMDTQDPLARDVIERYAEVCAATKDVDADLPMPETARMSGMGRSDLAEDVAPLIAWLKQENETADGVGDERHAAMTQKALRVLRAYMDLLRLEPSPGALAATKPERAAVANQFIRIVGSCGRRFFHHEGRFATFEVDHKGMVWWLDAYSEKRVYTHYSGRWRGFSGGGTMRNLVEALRDYIMAGKRPRLHLGPWPPEYCDGDLWGYGDDMDRVRIARDWLWPGGAKW